MGLSLTWCFVGSGNRPFGCTIATAWVALRACLCYSLCLSTSSPSPSPPSSALFPLLLHLSHVLRSSRVNLLAILLFSCNRTWRSQLLPVLNACLGCWKARMTKLAGSVKLVRVDKDGGGTPGDSDGMRILSFGRESSVSLLNSGPQPSPMLIEADLSAFGQPQPFRTHQCVPTGKTTGVSDPGRTCTLREGESRPWTAARVQSHNPRSRSWNISMLKLGSGSIQSWRGYWRNYLHRPYLPSVRTLIVTPIPRRLLRSVTHCRPGPRRALTYIGGMTSLRSFCDSRTNCSRPIPRLLCRSKNSLRRV